MDFDTTHTPPSFNSTSVVLNPGYNTAPATTTATTAPNTVALTSFLCRVFSPSFPSRLVTALFFPQFVWPYGSPFAVLARDSLFPGASLPNPYRPRDGEPSPAPGPAPPDAGYGVAPTGKVHSGTPLCPGVPIVVCLESIQRVWLGEPRMM
ncbi:hypothetical protein ARTHRO9AX_80485 [Arthrobacter sp. 9AX]|nr:hypothetical protein ARTHRO9AX_80485 [Arthrobacter sp. 9AX]